MLTRGIKHPTPGAPVSRTCAKRRKDEAASTAATAATTAPTASQLIPYDDEFYADMPSLLPHNYDSDDSDDEGDDALLLKNAKPAAKKVAKPVAKTQVVARKPAPEAVVTDARYQSWMNGGMLSKSCDIALDAVLANYKIHHKDYATATKHSAKHDQKRKKIQAAFIESILSPQKS